jgi:hypothetical protein
MTTWSQHGRVELREYLRTHTVATPHGVNYHRPLSTYLNHGLRLGARINEIAEPAPGEGLPAGELTEICEHIPNYVVVSLTFESRSGTR